MELFDVIDSKGNPAGQIVSREKAQWQLCTGRREI